MAKNRLPVLHLIGQLFHFILFFFIPWCGGFLKLLIRSSCIENGVDRRGGFGRLNSSLQLREGQSSIHIAIHSNFRWSKTIFTITTLATIARVGGISLKFSIPGVHFLARSLDVKKSRSFTQRGHVGHRISRVILTLGALGLILLHSWISCHVFLGFRECLFLHSYHLLT